MPDYRQLKICIVGAKGRMGALFKALWQGKVGAILELDLRPEHAELSEKDVTATVPLADVVILSVPIDKLENALKCVAPQLNRGSLLSDLSSVKTLPMQLMEQYHAGPVVGTHPLFGPESVQPAEKNMGQRNNAPNSPENLVSPQEPNPWEKQVALVAGRADKPGVGENKIRYGLELMAGLFNLAGCKSFNTSAAEHDRAIGAIQSLNFLSNLAYFATAANLPDLEKYITPSFRRRLNASRGMLQEDAGLFINIARHTPELQEVLQAYSRNLEKAANLENASLDDLLALARRCLPPNYNEQSF